MDKNTIIGFILIAGVLFGFSYFSRPSEAEIQQMQRQDSLEIVAKQQAEAAQKAQEAAAIAKKAEAALDSTSLFFKNRQGTDQNIVLQNNLVKITLGTRGGMVKEALLKDYNNQQGGPVCLLNEKDASMSFVLEGKNENLDSRDFFFTPVAATDSSVTMRLENQDGSVLDLEYKLHSDSYMLDLKIASSGLGRYFSPSMKTINLSWYDKAMQQEKGFDFENQYSTLTYKIKDEGTDYLNANEDKTEDVKERLDWVAFKNQFFSCVFIAHQDFTDATLSSTPQPKNSGYLKEYNAEMKTYFDPSGSKTTDLQLYFGPNNYHILSTTNDLSLSDKDLEMQDLVYLGWPLFKWINRFFIIYLFDWLNGLGLSMGIVLLLLTIIIKVLVYPTTRKSYIASAKMRVLKPKIDALNEKYPDPNDALKKQQEMMQLYSQYGANPMGGCLPMLIQMPFWIALFNFVPNAIELRGESFLWANDLSAYDDLIRWDTHIWLIGDHISIFCLLFCATNIINTWISTKQQQSAMAGEQAQQMKMMQYMMYFMPVFFFFMFNNYSSGLNYYYFLSSLTSILIMWYLKKTTDEKKLLAKMEAKYEANKKNPKKTSGFAARLEEMQKKQQAILEEQKRRQGQK